jgi:endogenous inhibitor of DNA gyrase (YacG/DUF329 family)
MINASCPICDKVLEGESQAEWPHFPFCSDRCKLIDLGRWLGESYRIAPAGSEDAAVDLDDENTSP